MLQASQLTKRYEDNQLALDTLNIEINAGQIFFLLGANGAGKTTTNIRADISTDVAAAGYVIWVGVFFFCKI